MPFRTWLFIAAFGLVFGLASLGQAQDTQEQPKGTETDTDQPAEPFSLRVDIVESVAEAEARKQAEDEANRRDENDLVAQQGMNEAAQTMLIYVRWQTELILAGTIMLGVTLYLTRQANRAALRAVSVTRELGETQLRAYMECEGFILDEKDPTEPKMIISFVNTGQTPATNIKCDLTFQTRKIGVEGFIVKGRSYNEYSSCGGGNRIRRAIGVPTEGICGDDVFPVWETFNFNVYGWVTYEDVFGAEHKFGLGVSTIELKTGYGL